MSEYVIDYLKDILGSLIIGLEPYFIFRLNDIIYNELGVYEIDYTYTKTYDDIIDYKYAINRHVESIIEDKLKQYVMGDIKYHVGLKRMVNSE